MTKYINISGSNAYDYYALQHIKERYSNVFQPKYGIIYNTQEDAVFVFLQRVGNAIYADERQNSFSSALAKMFMLSDKELMLIPLRITFQLEDEDYLSAHQNVILIDKRTNTMHRYDPAGASRFARDNQRNATIIKKLDDRLKKLCALFEGFTFEADNSYSLQSIEARCGSSLQNRGLCAFWCVLFVDAYAQSKETVSSVQQRLHTEIVEGRNCRKISIERDALNAAVGQRLCLDIPELANIMIYRQRRLSDREYFERKKAVHRYLDLVDDID